MMIGYISPSRSKLKYLTITMNSYIAYGIFLIDALGIKGAMRIGTPLIKGVPIITSWYVVFLATAIVSCFYEWLFVFLSKKEDKIVFLSRII